MCTTKVEEMYKFRRNAKLPTDWWGFFAYAVLLRDSKEE